MQKSHTFKFVSSRQKKITIHLISITANAKNGLVKGPLRTLRVSKQIPNIFVNHVGNIAYIGHLKETEFVCGNT